MKVQIFILGLLLFLPYRVVASWPVSEWPEVKFEEKITYNELCDYDGLCKKLKDRKDKFKFPHSIILKIFWLQKEELASIAKKYGIHPIIPMAAIATEHSLNVGIEDKWQDNLKSLGLDKNGRPLGLKAVSYGYGQLYKEAAMNAEKIVARIEERSQKDYKYVQMRIKSIQGAYEYVSALMLYYTEVYAQEGIDISHRPDILSTLYNIGKVDERIRMTMSEGRRPQPNYFGWFVEYNWKSFESIYTNNNFNLAYVSDLEQSLQESGNDGFVGIIIGSLQRNQVPTFTIMEEIPLRDSRPWCDVVDRDHFVSESDMDEREQIYLESLQNSQSHPFKEKGHFDIYAKGFDCLGRIWGLLHFADSGRMGWVNLESAGEFIEVTTKKRQCEESEVDPQCIDEIKELLDSTDDFLNYDEEQNIAYIRLGNNSFLEGNEINWQFRTNKDQNICNDASYRESLIKQYKFYIEKLKNMNTENIDKDDIYDSDELILEWILYFNERDIRMEKTYKSRNLELIEKMINDLKKKSLTNEDNSYIRRLTDADKKRLTPIIYQVIRKFEMEIGILNQTLLPEKIIMNIMDSSDKKDVSIYDSLFLDSFSTNTEDQFIKFISRDTNFKDFKFLYRFLDWGYNYFDCLGEKKECIIVVPIEEVEESIKDIIENGFHSNYVQERISYSIESYNWFYKIHIGSIRDRASVRERITIKKIMEYLNPLLLELSDFSEGIHKEIIQIYKYYSSIENTEFINLYLRPIRSIDYKINQLRTIMAYLNNDPVDLSFAENCSIDSYDLSNPLLRVNSIPCKYFHLFLWNDENLQLMIRGILRNLIQSSFHRISYIRDKVSQGLSPSNSNFGSILMKRDISKRRIEDVKDRIAKCNYNPIKTFDIVKGLSQSSCVDKLLLPAEKLLNNKSREEGIYFNTFPFGEYKDRMGIKLKSICK